MPARTRLFLPALLAALVLISAPAMASHYRYINEIGDTVIAQQPPEDISYAVIDDDGQQLWYVPAQPLPLSHWRPFWTESPDDELQNIPFELPKVRQRRPVVTIEELGVQ